MQKCVKVINRTQTNVSGRKKKKKQGANDGHHQLTFAKLVTET